MDRARFLSHVVVFFIFALTACGPQAAVPTQVPVEPPATAVPAPVETAVPTEAVPVVATSPPMEVGSTFQYFDGSVLVAVPGGPFIMGAGGQDNPIRTVNVSDFWIYQVEVTNRMYGLCVTMGVCSLPDSTDNPLFGNVAEENKPVVGVDWGQASAYCGFVNGRLPTEAEWEKTARGPDGNKFPWGNQEPTCNLLNFDACMRKTTYVGTYPDGQSYYKAMDMSGNVFEWVQDWYWPTTTARHPRRIRPAQFPGTIARCAPPRTTRMGTSPKPPVGSMRSPLTTARTSASDVLWRIRCISRRSAISLWCMESVHPSDRGLARWSTSSAMSRPSHRGLTARGLPSQSIRPVVHSPLRKWIPRIVRSWEAR
jgi:formylglycine-generating enzyme required for sulfatase activity